MEQALSIRVATEADAPALLALYQHLSADNALVPQDRAEAIIAQIGQYTGSAILLGEVEGEAVSSCTLVVVPNLTRGGTPYALIENVVTRKDRRGLGFGKAMLAAACERAWAYDCYKVMLSTGSKKPGTLAFYEAAGFEQSRTGFQIRRIAKRIDV